MWIPTPIYERLPQFWLLLGLLFMSSGTYLGFDYSLSFVYFGLGLVCSLWSMYIFTKRLTARKPSESDLASKQEEETAEDLSDAETAA